MSSPARTSVAHSSQRPLSSSLARSRAPTSSPARVVAKRNSAQPRTGHQRSVDPSPPRLSGLNSATCSQPQIAARSAAVIS